MQPTPPNPPDDAARGVDTARLNELASIGLATRTTSSALLHAIRGRLHDATMLVALLQSHPRAAPEEAAAAAKIAQRVQTLSTQLDILARNIAVFGNVVGRHPHDADAVCAPASAVDDVARLLQSEAARRRVAFSLEPAGVPSPLRATLPGFQQALLCCGAWIVQQMPERGTLRLSARDEEDSVVFEFDVDPESLRQIDAHADDVRLLDDLARGVGGRFTTSPRMRVSFSRAPAGRG